jgi:hypothetical protein
LGILSAIRDSDTAVNNMFNHQALDGILRTLADTTRRSIAEHLTRAALSIGEYGEPFNISLACVMRYVQVLEGSVCYWRTAIWGDSSFADRFDQLELASLNGW